VFELAVYRRTPPSADRGRLQRLRDSHRRPVMVMTSSEGVRNLFRLAGPELHDWLRGLRYAALAPRVAVALREHGVRTPPVLANDTGDSALADAALAADAAHPLPELEAH